MAWGKTRALKEELGFDEGEYLRGKENEDVVRWWRGLESENEHVTDGGAYACHNA